MNELSRAIADEDLLWRLTAGLRGKNQGPLSWLLIDGSQQGLPACRVFWRPWLRLEGSPPGFSLATPLPLSEALPAARARVALYTRATYRPTETDLETLAVLLASGATVLSFRIEGQSIDFTLPPGTPWQPLPRPAHETSRLPLQLKGSGRRDLDVTLPCLLDVSSPQASESFAIAVRDATFKTKALSFELTAGAPLGRGTLVVAAHLDDSGDRLEVTARDFGSQPVLSLAAEKPQRRSAARIHALFDRTTLDLEAWPRARDAADVEQSRSPTAGFAGFEDDAVADQENAPEHLSWNEALRKHLAPALAEGVSRHFPRAELILWWFADRRRSELGIEMLSSLPLASASYGRVGSCPTEKLARVLPGVVFDFATGLDLVDAVDEALSAVAAEISRDQAGGPHVVLILGDSPPPPRDGNDPLWRHLVAGPPQTNARCSPLFQKALVDLASLDVPVGWLFLRHLDFPTPPSSPDGRLALLVRNDYATWLNLRESILAALQQVPGLSVEASSAGLSSVSADLGKLLQRLKAPAKQVSRLQLELVRF